MAAYKTEGDAWLRSEERFRPCREPFSLGERRFVLSNPIFFVARQSVPRFLLIFFLLALRNNAEVYAKVYVRVRV